MEPPFPPPANAAPQQQPWADNTPLASRLPIAHPWATSPHAYVAPLLLLPGRIRGKLSPYREGWLCMVPEGMVLSGKAVPEPSKGTLLKRAGIYFLFGSVLGTLMAENALMQPRLDALSWDCVEEIVLNQRKGRICVVYHLPDAPDKPLSLGLRLSPPPLFAQFAGAATHYLGPEKVHEGKIGPPSSPVQTAIAAVIILLIVVGGIIASELGNKTP